MVAFCETCSLREASRRTGIKPNRHYAWCNEDSQYLRAYWQAKDVSADTLESELIRRAFSGVKRYKFHQGQIIMVPCAQGDEGAVEMVRGGQTVFMRPYEEHEYSDTLGIFLMKGMRPEKYRERYEVRDTTEQVDEEIDGLLAQLATREKTLAAESSSGTNGRNGN